MCSDGWYSEESEIDGECPDVVNLPWKALPRADAITPRWCVKPAVLNHVMEAVRMEL